MRHFLLLAIAAAVTATPATASNTVDATGYEPRSVRVSYADLNLSTEAGMARFKSRLAGAVKRVCPTTDGVNLQRIMDNRRCVEAARARFDTQIAAAAKAQAVALAAKPSVAIAAQ